jgi:hypothetical protein
MQLSPRDVESPVAFFANGIGDHLLALPAIRALASLWPARLRLICPNGGRELFFADVDVRRTIEADIRRSVTGGRVFDAASLAAETVYCDCFLSLVAWDSPSLRELVERLAPRSSVGFRPYFRCVLDRDYRRHSADLAFDVPRAFDPTLRLQDFSSPPRLPAWAEGSACRIRRALPTDAVVLVVHVETVPEKMLPEGVLTSAVNRFLGAHPRFFVLIVGRRHHPHDHGAHAHRVISCHGLPLAVSLAVVSTADMFLGVDSCMLHAADFFRVPGVGLFGPTRSGEFGFRFTRHRHVEPGNTMAQITADEIVDALNVVWAERGVC